MTSDISAQAAARSRKEKALAALEGQEQDGASLEEADMSNVRLTPKNWKLAAPAVTGYRDTESQRCTSGTFYCDMLLRASHCNAGP